MKKLLTISVVLLSVATLSACGNDKSAKNDTSSHISSKVKPSAEKTAKNDVDALFDDSEHTKLLDGTTHETIADVENEVNNLKSSDTKTELLADVKIANELWPNFKKNVDQKNAAENSKTSSKARSEEASEAASSSKADAESSKKAAEESSRASSKAASSKAASEAEAKQPANNTVYGPLTDPQFKRNRLALYVSKGVLKYVSIKAVSKLSIDMVHLDYTDIPLMLDDTELWNDYIHDWTEQDTALKTKLSDTEYIYHSNKIDKDYQVKFTLNNDGDISHIYISQTKQA